jgi:hypothetical protein
MRHLAIWNLLLEPISQPTKSAYGVGFEVV